MTGFAGSVIDLSIPITAAILFACLGEIVAERAGVLNLGIEGIMSVSALTGIAVSGLTGSHWFGLAGGILAGVIISLLLGVFCISMKSDPIITGVMITLLGVSLTTFFGEAWTGTDVSTFTEVSIPLLVELPVVGQAIFKNDLLVYFAFLTVPLTWLFLFNTNLGMEIIAVGDDPETADTMGIDVFKIKYLAILICGILAGIGGVLISLSFADTWTAGLVDGRGWVAVALVIFARWRPLPALGGSFLFGLIFAAQFPMQGVDPSALLPLGGALGAVYDFFFHPIIMSTYPFFFTIAVLALAAASGGRAVSMPQSLLSPYMREN
jgi:simple sugar transport system permease protein